MKRAEGALEVLVLDDQPLPEVGEEPGALATLCFPRQDHCRNLGVQFGGAERRGAGSRRVAVCADPEVNGAHYRVILQLLDLPIKR